MDGHPWTGASRHRTELGLQTTSLTLPDAELERCAVARERDEAVDRLVQDDPG